MSKALGGAAQGAAAGSVAGPWGAAIGGAVGLVGGIMADDAASAEAKAQAKAAAERMALYNSIAIPEEFIDYKQLSDGAMIDPRMGVAEQLSMQDNLANIQLDPRLANAKTQALESLQSIASGGFTAEEMMDMSRNRNAIESDLTSKLKQIDQQQQSRGVNTSDMGIAQKMLEAQSAANRGAQDAREREARAMGRSLQAISDSGNLAANYENTDYNRQQALANSLNSRENTNLQQRATVNRDNISAFNDALRTNVGRLNTVSDANTGLVNQQQQDRNTIKGRKFDREMDLAGAKSGLSSRDSTRTAQQFDQDQARTGSMYSDMIKTGGALYAQNKDTKKDANKTQVVEEPVVYAGKGNKNTGFPIPGT